MTGSVVWKVQGGHWRTRAEQGAAARRLLCRMLGEEVEVGHTPDGAPYLPQRPGLRLSISHCPTAVAVALGEGRAVGIDVERRRRVDDGLVGRVCTAAEQEAVRTAADPTMAFLRLWTKKEAVLKMRGTGIRGFGSMVAALGADDATVEELPCEVADTVAALAFLQLD